MVFFCFSKKGRGKATGSKAPTDESFSNEIKKNSKSKGGLKNVKPARKKQKIGSRNQNLIELSSSEDEVRDVLEMDGYGYDSEDK